MLDRSPPSLRPRSFSPALLFLLLAAALAACSSPNRGVWRGEFSGSVSGVVELRINARGTRLTGEVEGETRDGQPFQAEMEGKLKGDFFYAEMKGVSRTGLRPIPFTGFVRGELSDGRGGGDWEAEVPWGPAGLRGEFRVEQVTGEP